MEQPPLRRSGRITKKPDRYEPIEQVTDDFDDGEYDSDSEFSGSDCDSVITESTYVSDGDEEDTKGNLKGFVVDSDEESEPESTDSEPDPEPEPEPEPKKKRKYTRKNKNAVKDTDINLDI